MKDKFKAKVDLVRGSINLSIGSPIGIEAVKDKSYEMFQVEAFKKDVEDLLGNTLILLPGVPINFHKLLLNHAAQAADMAMLEHLLEKESAKVKARDEEIDSLSALIPEEGDEVRAWPELGVLQSIAYHKAKGDAAVNFLNDAAPKGNSWKIMRAGQFRLSQSGMGSGSLAVNTNLGKAAAEKALAEAKEKEDAKPEPLGAGGAVVDCEKGSIRLKPGHKMSEDIFKTTKAFDDLAEQWHCGRPFNYSGDGLWEMNYYRVGVHSIPYKCAVEILIDCKKLADDTDREGGE